MIWISKHPPIYVWPKDLWYDENTEFMWIAEFEDMRWSTGKIIRDELGRIVEFQDCHIPFPPRTMMRFPDVWRKVGERK